MIQKSTTSCRSHQHPEFRINYDPKIAIELDVDWLLTAIGRSVASGERFTDGQTFQVGWMVTLIRANEDGTLSILEPDMKCLPVVWVDSVTSTLCQLRLQKDTVESVLAANDLCFPSMRESAVICNRFGAMDGFVMDRTRPSKGDSGWFCGCREADHDHHDVEQLTRVSLFEASLKYPGIVPFLALPAGVLVGVKQKAPAIFRGDERLSFHPGSCLHRLFGEKRQ